FGPDRRGAQPRSARCGAHERSSERLELLRPLRGSLPGQDSLAEDHAPLACARIRGRPRSKVSGSRAFTLGLPSQAAIALSDRDRAHGTDTQDSFGEARRRAGPTPDARLVPRARFPRAARQDLSRTLEGKDMNARESILKEIRDRRLKRAPEPERYRAP